MLSIQNLIFSYSDTPVLKNISFTLEKKSICALFGPNGSGKTTLLKCICGLNKLNCGEILLNGVDICRLSIRERAKLISYVPQSHNPSFPFTVKEIALMGKSPYIPDFGFGPSSFYKDEICNILKLLEIYDLKDRPYTELSQGQRQLVLLAKAIAQNPTVMLLDEPLSNLDFKNILNLWSIFKKLSQEKDITTIITTHDPNQVLWYCNTVIVINDGRVLTQGDPKMVLTEEILKKLYGFGKIEKIHDRTIVIP